MRAVIQDRYGHPEHLRVREVADPRPGAGEVLVAVRAASVHPDVWHVVMGRPGMLRVMGAGLVRPRQPIPGTDCAGTVVDVGSDVTGLAPGDEVFGETIRGIQWTNGGAYADLACAPAAALVPKPPQVGFAEAASVATSGLIALENLPPAERLDGARVVVIGAAGGVGSIALQVAVAHGATVTGVDRGDKLDTVTSLGAHDVIDHTVDDYTEAGRTWDLVFDVVRSHRFGDVRRVLADDGVYVLIGHDHFGAEGGRLFGTFPGMVSTLAAARGHALERTGSNRHARLPELAALLASGAITPVIDSVFGLDEVPAALAHLASGRARGRIVVSP